MSPWALGTYCSLSFVSLFIDKTIETFQGGSSKKKMIDCTLKITKDKPKKKNCIMWQRMAAEERRRELLPGVQ